MSIKRANLLVNVCLMSAFLYYIHGVNIVEDSIYDNWIKELRECIHLSTMKHKDLIDLNTLKTSTSLYYITEEAYPNSLKHTAWYIFSNNIKLNEG